MDALASIILAGGESRRMGEPKLLLEHQGKSLLAHAIEKARGLSPHVNVVVGAYAELYRAEALQYGVNVIEAQDWREGQGASLRAGIVSLKPQIEYCYVLLADQPFVDVEHLEQLYRTAKETSADLVFSSYDGVQGPPALLHRSLFKAAAQLQSHKGAKALIKDDTKVLKVSLSTWQDIDTPQDVEQFLDVQS